MIGWKRTREMLVLGMETNRQHSNYTRKGGVIFYQLLFQRLYTIISWPKTCFICNIPKRFTKLRSQNQTTDAKFPETWVPQGFALAHSSPRQICNEQRRNSTVIHTNAEILGLGVCGGEAPDITDEICWKRNPQSIKIYFPNWALVWFRKSSRGDCKTAWMRVINRNAAP